MMEFEIGGVKRGFKLGTYTFKMINEVTGTKTIDEVFERIKSEDQGFVLSFYFCCAKHWTMFNKQEVNFNEMEVAEWLDDLGMDKVFEVTQELFKVYMSKNRPALATGLEPSMNGKH